MKHCILFESEVPCDSEEQRVMEEAICAALAEEQVELPCEISVLLTDDRGIQNVNEAMRGVHRPTDVLSFPMFPLSPGQLPQEEHRDLGSGLVPLGDICLSLERAKAQAGSYGHSLERELAYLMVHSVLHLLGYDHLDEGEEKANMRAREEAILSSPLWRSPRDGSVQLR